MITITRFKSFNETELRSSGQIMSDILNSKRRWPLKNILIFKQSRFSPMTGTSHTSYIFFVSVLRMISLECSNCLSVLIYDTLLQIFQVGIQGGFLIQSSLRNGEVFFWIKQFICIKYIMLIIICICFFFLAWCLALSLLPMVE